MKRFVYCIDDATGEEMFLNRDLVESTAYRLCRKNRVRQVIPYIVVLNEEKKVALFQRLKGDKRLKSGYTIGTGGHIEPIDTIGASDDILFNAARRELDEELGVHSCTNLEMTNIQIKSDDTPVDQVHLGFVFVTELPFFRCADGELEFVGWKTFDELKNVSLESWSMKIRKDLEKWISKMS